MRARRQPFDTTRLLAAGLGLGAGLMYALDPVRGRRRRSLARDKVTHLVSRADDALGVTYRDMANRARGVLAEARATMRRVDVDDDVLEQRVRAKLGLYVSHPRSITVVTNDGRVFLSGTILSSEVEPLMAAIRGIRGVQGIENRLDEHETAADISGLQGGIPRNGEHWEMLQANWSPTARVLAGLAGGALAWWGAGRGRLGNVAGLLGTVLFARGATNLETRRLLGIGASRRAVDVAKIITVKAPVELVWEYWRDYRNFPSFMSHVREVRDLGEGRSHWVVDGPAGSRVEWDARLTAEKPNEIIAWKSEPRSLVQHAGVVRLEPVTGGGTRIDVRMSYNPPAGAIGHGLAAILGADPNRLLNDDLLRMKSFIETGVVPRDAAAPSS